MVFLGQEKARDFNKKYNLCVTSGSPSRNVTHIPKRTTLPMVQWFSGQNLRTIEYDYPLSAEHTHQTETSVPPVPTPTPSVPSKDTNSRDSDNWTHMRNVQHTIRYLSRPNTLV